MTAGCWTDGDLGSGVLALVATGWADSSDGFSGWRVCRLLGLSASDSEDDEEDDEEDVADEERRVLDLVTCGSSTGTLSSDSMSLLLSGEASSAATSTDTFRTEKSWNYRSKTDGQWQEKVRVLRRQLECLLPVQLDWLEMVGLIELEPRLAKETVVLY